MVRHSAIRNRGRAANPVLRSGELGAVFVRNHTGKASGLDNAIDVADDPWAGQRIAAQHA